MTNGGKVFKLKIEGQGTNIEQEIDEDQMLQILSIAVGGGSELTPAGRDTEPKNLDSDTTESASSSERTTSSVSIGEFMADLNVSSNTARIAAIALYLKEHLDRTLVTKEEIPEWFQRAGETAPKNLSRDLQNAIKDKMIAEDHSSPGHYYVTSTGEKELRSIG